VKNRQEVLVQSLLKPNAYPHSVSEIELIETHISWIFLTGNFAYKIKKPVQFDFLDFSTLEKRHFYCEEELRLNRRFAPNLYLQVIPITGTVEHPQINGSGETIEYAVKMRQFPANQLLNEMANCGDLNAEIVDQFADLTAKFHRHANTDISESCYGTSAEIQRWFSGNFSEMLPFLELTKLALWGEKELSKNAPLIEQRKQHGFIRECHGDLHLGNIVWFENRVTPFDGIEFNSALRWIDVMNEVAFAVMDLEQRNFKPFAYRFLNRYLSQTGDYSGLSLLRYYCVYRALVRAKIALLRWQQHQNSPDFSEAENYAAFAEGFTTQKSPLLIITHGFSGSGKSTVSAQLAENLGLIHLRSDVERQRLFEKSEQNIYSSKHTQQTYQTLADFAATILHAGFSVLVDATFLKLDQRALFQKLAANQNVEFFILDFQATKEELSRRILQRQQLGNDFSEATLAVLQQQIKSAQSLISTEQHKTIQIENVADALKKLLHHLQGEHHDTTSKLYSLV
jgi:aminoglycoside phosphotransferase family enzyme/predicted kinase